MLYFCTELCLGRCILDIMHIGLWVFEFKQNKLRSPWMKVKKVGEKKKNLGSQRRTKFGEPEVVEDAATNLPGEQPNHCDNDIPNNFDLPPTDAEIPARKHRLDQEDETISIRCTPSRWCRIVNKLSEEQKEEVRALGFGNLFSLNCGRLRLKICRWLVENFDSKACAIHIHGRRFVINSSVFAGVLGISDHGDRIAISEDVPNKEFWGSKFPMTSRGIFLKDIEHRLKEMTTADDEFKISVGDFFKQPAQSEGQCDVGAHGATSRANEEPVTANKAHTKDGNQKSLNKSMSKLRESYMYDIRGCEKIYIPINDLRNYWYLVVVHLKKWLCEIWDSKPPRRKDDLTRLNQVSKLSLDIVLADEIVVAFPTTFSFTTFKMSYAKAPEQANGFDCGLLLCMFMDDNYPTPLQMKSFQSDCQRLVLARFLALFPGNNDLLSLKKNAQQQCTKLVANGKMRPPPMQKLRAFFQRLVVLQAVKRAMANQGTNARGGHCLFDGDFPEDNPDDHDYNMQNLEEDPDVEPSNQRSGMSQVLSDVQEMRLQMDTNHQTYMEEFAYMNARMDSFQRGLTDAGINIPYVQHRATGPSTGEPGSSSQSGPQDPTMPRQHL
ncbi:hypothetical protein Dsin_018084 [Dipteronia sinensis]|uniref:Ubiquitin-like protease family profile domain-containing protein n=1 Tax=Dipteronia sinensis TaxID=43782 RepID=A0AAE0AGW1_9ROSI|nr:hypothetical protein Dsin_018084 [Dipteronia sinensis]